MRNELSAVRQQFQSWVCAPRVCVTAPASAHFLQEPARASELSWQSLPFSPRDKPSLSRTFGSCFRRLRGRQLECIHRSTAIISNVAARPCHRAGLQRHRCDKELSDHINRRLRRERLLLALSRLRRRPREQRVPASEVCQAISLSARHSDDATAPSVRCQGDRGKHRRS